MAELEHANLTVADARSTAKLLCSLFDWKVRWEGSAMNGLGHTVHVGSEGSYVALYSPNEDHDASAGFGDFNHLGVVVDDLDAVEAKVVSHGYKPTLHADYEPGRRFYFLDDNGIEYEVVSYD